MVERLAFFDEIGIDEVILNFNIGEEQAETLEAMERFARDVMPHFQPTIVRQSAR